MAAVSILNTCSRGVQSPKSHVKETVTSIKTVEPSPLNTVDDLLRQRASEYNQPALVAYPASPASPTDYEGFTARDLDGFANAASRRLVSLGLDIADPNEKSPVAALLGPSTLNYLISIFSLSRLGYTVLLLSSRLSVPAYISLLEKTECRTVISTSAFNQTVADIQRERQMRSLPMLDRADYHSINAASFARKVDSGKETSKIAFIIHSSGSTGLPKPIFQSHSACLANYSNGFGLRSFTTLPLFHNHGLCSLFRAIYSRKLIYFYNAHLPLTGPDLMSTLQYVKPEIVQCVPYALKLLNETAGGLGELRKAKIVLYGGSSCPDELGNFLVENGVNLVGHYGSTEVGQLMTSLRPSQDKTWDYNRLDPKMKPYILMDKVAENTYECVVLDGLKSKVTSNSDDPPNSFRTRDLFAPHPTIPDAWKYLGRLDDRVTLMNGEKVLPLPIEGRVREEEIVREAIVFGVGKAVAGIFVFRSAKASGYSDTEFIERIWPAIEDANSRAEAFSQIPKEMVVPFPVNTEYPRTDKSTFIRAQVYKQFHNEIEEAYVNYENGQSGSLALEVPQLEDFLMQKFREDLDVALDSVKSDFFATGVDSLQAIRMWGIIKRNLDLGGRQSELSQNVVFEKPNVSELARHLYAMHNGSAVDGKDEIQIMKDLVSRYSSFQDHVAVNKPQPEKQGVLVTGATGSLGAHLLAQLVKQENVSRIWALVRATSPKNAAERVTSALQARSLALSPSEEAKIIALPVDLGHSDLGLPEDTIREMKSGLSLVVHSAWAVNFNLGVQSFESQHIRGLHNLIQLSLATETPEPAKFFFCSSISAAAGTPVPATIGEGPVERFEHAQNMGYARSKLVAEHIVRNAALTTRIHARVLRIGQIVGDSKIGLWNDTEAIPLMIRSALTLKVLPALDETPSWLPVDYLSSVIMELIGVTREIPSNRLRDPSLVYHVLNPNRFRWTEDLLPALKRAGLSFEIVPQREWIHRLRTGDQDPTKNPPVKLTSFFADKYDNDGPGRNGLDFETTRTEEDSPTLKGAPHLVQDGFVEKFVSVWMRKWTSS